MKLLLDRISGSQNKLVLYDKIRKDANQINILKQIREVLYNEMPLEQLKEDIEIFNIFKDNNIAVALPQTTKVKSNLEVLLNNNNPAQQSQSNIYYILRSDVKELQKMLKDMLSSSWANHTKRTMFKIGDIHPNLSKIKSYGPLIGEIFTARDKLTTKANFMPRRAKDIQEFDQLNADLRLKYNNFEQQCPAKIRNFVTACATKGTSISSLNDKEIQEWINQNNLEMSLCVKFKSDEI